MTRTERLEERGWKILASDRDDHFDAETFVAMNSCGYVSVLYFYETGDGERYVDQYFESSLVDSSEDLEVLNESPELFLEIFYTGKGDPDWSGLENTWWKR